MTIREFERRRSDPVRDREVDLSQFRILSFAQWCALNGISAATGRRIIKSGRGPSLVRLSDRRFGITVASNAAWQAARASKPETPQSKTAITQSE
jgi:predicted DNA-binding transcriptional regulator AlpA